MAKKYEPELGQMAFGNPPSEFVATWATNMLQVISDAIGKSQDTPDDDSYGYNYENDVFVMRKYYWGEEDDKASAPNFLYKKTGLEIRWYKYIGRGMSANVEKIPDNWDDILIDCLVSIKNAQRS